MSPHAEEPQATSRNGAPPVEPARPSACELAPPIEEEKQQRQVDEERDECVSSASASYDDFCGQQASEIRLRQLKMSALEDVLVCGQSRQATESARRLFSTLASHALKSPQSRSLSSHSSGRGDEVDDDDQDHDDSPNGSDEELLALNQSPDGSGEDSGKLFHDIYSGRSGDSADDYGTIKIVRRKCCASPCSDSSPAHNNCGGGGGGGHHGPAFTHSNFGRTLVCSVSPIGSSCASSQAEPGGQSESGEPFDTSCYPIDGDEIRQCRAAFRENRRLIEQAQTLARKRLQEQAAETPTRGSNRLSRSSSQLTTATDRSHWADSLSRRARLPDCSHCDKKLYPLDRMELDFTRAKLNIHRNCFKCQVCSSLLR